MKPRSPRTHRMGFTLVEVIVALVIFTVGLMGLMGTSMLATRMIVHSQQTAIGVAWPLRTVILNSRSSVLLEEIRPAEPSIFFTTTRAIFTLSSAPKPRRSVSSFGGAERRRPSSSRSGGRRLSAIASGRLGLPSTTSASTALPSVPESDSKSSRSSVIWKAQPAR